MLKHVTFFQSKRTRLYSTQHGQEISWATWPKPQSSNQNWYGKIQIALNSISNIMATWPRYFFFQWYANELEEMRIFNPIVINQFLVFRFFTQYTTFLQVQPKNCYIPVIIKHVLNSMVQCPDILSNNVATWLRFFLIRYDSI